MKKMAVILLVLFILVAAGLSWITMRFRNTLPKKGGVTGAAADAVARTLQKRIRHNAWKKIGAIRWKFRKVHHHVWDKRRQYIQVKFGKKAQYKVQMALHARKKGIVWKGGKELTTGKERDRALRLAYAFWANDSFWLNPLAKLFDKGVTRTLFKDKQSKRLLISFASGGVTPGDKYLFVLGKNGLPKRFQMWVKILPIPGISVDFERWTDVGGALLSLDHKLTKWSRVHITLNDVKAASSIEKLESKDIFLPLHYRLHPQARRKVPTRRPTSVPVRRAPAATR